MRTVFKLTVWAIALSALTSSLHLVETSAQIIVIDCDSTPPDSSISVVESGTPTTVFESSTTIACDDEPDLDSSIHITPWECEAAEQGSDLSTLLDVCDPNSRSMEFLLRDDDKLFGKVKIEDGLPDEASFDLPNTGYVHIAGASAEATYVDAGVFCTEISEATPGIAGSLAAFDEMTLDGHILVFENGVSNSAETPIHLDCYWFVFYK